MQHMKQLTVSYEGLVDGFEHEEPVPGFFMRWLGWDAQEIRSRSLNH